MYQHMKFDHTFLNGIFKTELNIRKREVKVNGKVMVNYGDEFK